MALKGNGRCDWDLYCNLKREWESKSKSLRKKLFSLNPHVCVFCGVSDKLTADHIIPLRKGGLNILSNLQIACLECNRKKGIKNEPNAVA